MNQPSTEIRSATPDEVRRAVAVILAAFIQDPPARFAWPSPHDYLRPCLWLPGSSQVAPSHGTAYVSADLCGAAMPPGVEANSEPLGKMRRDTAKREHLDDLLATFGKMEQSHPREPHWYLPQIGVDQMLKARALGRH